MRSYDMAYRKNEVDSIIYDMKLFLKGEWWNPPCINKIEETMFGSPPK